MRGWAAPQVEPKCRKPRFLSLGRGGPWGEGCTHGRLSPAHTYPLCAELNRGPPHMHAPTPCPTVKLNVELGLQGVSRSAEVTAQQA